MAKHTNIFLTVALLSLLYTTLLAQGRSVAYHGEKFVPVQRPLDELLRSVFPTAGSVTLRNCDRCTCCSPVICQTMNCCMESVCTPGGGCAPAKSISCHCDTNTCA